MLEASRGKEALLIAEKHDVIDLVLSDLIMPGMNGREVTRHLEGIKPGLRTIYMSGYSDAAILNEGILESDMPFLNMPFTPDALLRKVREVPDQKKDADVASNRLQESPAMAADPGFGRLAVSKPNGNLLEPSSMSGETSRVHLSRQPF